MSDWQNRIVGYGVKPAKEFVSNPQNWRIHPQIQQRTIQGSLNELGWIDIVLVNANTGHLIDGHERVQQALDNNNADVPYIEVDLSEQEEKKALAILDPIVSMIETDIEKLDILLHDLEVTDTDLQQMLTMLAEEHGLDLEYPADFVEDPHTEWQGLPEFEQEKEKDNKITVYFIDDSGREELSNLLKQIITPRTKFIWFPPEASPIRQSIKSLIVESHNES